MTWALRMMSIFDYHTIYFGTATLQQVQQQSVQSQACLSYAERQQLSTKSTLQQKLQLINNFF